MKLETDCRGLLKRAGLGLALSALSLALAFATVVPSCGNAAEPRIVRIVAKKFSYTPSQVRLKKGEPVTLELVSEDRIHGFNLPELKIRKDVGPREVTRVALTPDKAGTFSFRCDVFCGDGHEDMTGTLIVSE